MTWQNAYDDPSNSPSHNADITIELSKQKEKYV
jgi:hypothetical protein